MKYLFLTLLLLPFIGFSQVQDVQMDEEKTKNGVIIYVTNNLQQQSIDVVLELTSEGFGLKEKEIYELTIEPKSKEKIVQLVAQANTKYSYASSLSYKTSPVERIVEQTVTTKTRTESVGEKRPAPAKSTSANKPNNQQKVKEDNDPLKGKKGIVVYSKQGCGRCHLVTDYLKKNNIPFEDLNITSDKAADRQMSTVLFASGFKGGSFTTPVITVDEDVHYNIKDLKGFLAELKSK